MTNLRARLADALFHELDEHGYEDDDEKHGQVAHHFADVLLSLPDIAIVDTANVELLREAFRQFDEYAPTNIADYTGVAGVINAARTLLAAANAAEKET